MSTRRSSRTPGGASTSTQVYGRRGSRRVRDEDDDDDDEGRVEQTSKKRRQEGNAQNGSTSKDRRARQPTPVEEEAEDEDEDEDDDGEGVVVDDDDDEEEPDADGDGGLWGILPIKKLKVSTTALKAAEAIGQEEVKRRANDLARLALFNEHRRTALKREDITKKVLDKNSAKAFPVVYNRAQKVLRYTFGYEMVELRVKGIDNDLIRFAGQTQAEQDDDQNASTSAKSRTYILRSVLPAKAIAAMATPSATLSAPVNNVNDTVDGQAFDSEGVMLDWKRSSSELGSLGLLFFVLSMILINGRSISDDQLRSYLRRMSLDPEEVLPSALQPDARKESRLTMDDYLQQLLKQSYLECNRTGAAPQGAMSMDTGSLLGKRVQARGKKSRTEEGVRINEENEWRWGPRAEVEITEKAVAEFVSQIYMDSDGQDQDDDALVSRGQGQDDLETSRAKKQELLLKSIEHAAGSQLIS